MRVFKLLGSSSLCVVMHLSQQLSGMVSTLFFILHFSFFSSSFYTFFFLFFIFYIFLSFLLPYLHFSYCLGRHLPVLHGQDWFRKHGSGSHHGGHDFYFNFSHGQAGQEATPSRRFIDF